MLNSTYVRKPYQHTNPPQTAEDLFWRLQIGDRITTRRPAPQHFSVRTSVYFEVGAKRCVWIDGVCINQSDIAEKNIQVPMMGQIYTKAAKCIAWLGPSTEQLDKMIHNLPDMLEKAKTYTGPVHGFVPDQVFIDHDIPIRSPSPWLELAALLSRPWFQRVWVVQEAVLPASLELVCGNRIVDLNALTSLVNDFETITRTFMAACTQSPISSLVNRGWSCWGHIAQLRTGVSVPNSGTRRRLTDLQTLILVTRDFAASNSVHKIYGMLGMADAYWVNLLTVDYTALAAAAMAYSQCPNYYQTTSTNSLATSFFEVKYHAGFRQWADVEDPPDYRRDIGTSPRDDTPTFEELQSCFIADSTCFTLDVFGFRVERIAESIPSDWNTEWLENTSSIADLEQFLAWEAQCFLFSQRTCKSPNKVLECYWRTLIANKIREPGKCRKCDIDYSSHYEAILGLRKEVGRSDQNISNKKCSVELQKRRGRDGDIMSSIQFARFLNSVIDACHGRSFFSTKSGRIGLGPPDTKPEDIVCIFYNGCTPFIVRTIGNDGIGNKYQFLGKSYVDGLMYGEAFELEASNRSTRFNLH
ncbi:hypothetical protein NA56DRAFT_705262 [Hyaloscypha hepaticicola]|uniref:Heterokaryon incompatibility domain-containing protein n=1 Tax=Hyaloscypha hepaticicola TaxID=2082293 RepID=A0A2J6Q166_9HELO|nr:hypothetical protein NA56DRAFT_705262 [Hyaloscypha hepaticicola]